MVDERNKTSLLRRCLVASAVLHVIGLSVAATTVMHSSRPRARFAGSAVLIVADFVEPTRPASEIVLDAAATRDVHVLVTPRWATVEKQRFSDVPAQHVNLADLVADILVAQPRPVERPRAVAAPEIGPADASRARLGRQPPQVSVAVASTRIQLPRRAAQSPGQPDAAASLAGNVPPHYPDRARQQGWEGTVWVRLTIGTDGAVSDVEIARSSGYDILDAAAVNAVRRWRAKPARRSGRPVATVEVLPLRFRLR